ncbi:hypothetical protein EMIHUDRAFT_244765 [Emiliania huxleyi CCMP1516]|uniref:Uncharacterized protein n=2 Tax=Emiliania huxleyi TaxID=2903 RepID=A0A0D3IZK8_EMIH1|nr:hypothetical protein EMIHUDRAFT_244765 [Emiliania huxleyi CCMP1516]EOD16693.1 hypothetical protein EMIHUDRAFT_244765 [Emiliania huxleyi CCMP1516]|eukprot:XP_005769122.1 hypothetical protein EMIHUDRAFT_244765 [Emiliania huxleyi CCMP1516]
MLHTSLGGPSEEYAAGWTILRPFVTRAASGDVSDGSSAAIKACVPPRALAPLYQGSPLALQHLSAGAAPESHLRSAGGELRYALRKQAALLQAAHLLSEHAFYSSCDPVPGLLPGQRDGSTGALDLSGLSAPRLQATGAQLHRLVMRNFGRD